MSLFRWIGMGKSGAIGDTTESQQGEERFFGLENFGNTCYSNSVMQVLFFCKPFRDCVLNYSYPESAAQLAALMIEDSAGLPPSLLLTTQGLAAAPQNRESIAVRQAYASAAGASVSAAHDQVDSRIPGDSLSRSGHGGTSGSVSLAPGAAPGAATATATAIPTTATTPAVGNGLGLSSTMPINGAPSSQAAYASGSLLSQSSSSTNPGGRGIWAGSRIAALIEGISIDQSNNDTLLSALQDLFLTISTQKKRTGVIPPRQFIQKLKLENEAFRSTMQQDAHEMFNYLLNAVAELLTKQRKEMTEKLIAAQRFPKDILDARNADSRTSDIPSTWIHALFEGLLTNETKCLNCECVTNRDESFLDLSVDIEQHSSISSCLRNFSSSEVLCERNKFFCDTCNSLQEAEKRMKIKRLPNVLAVHLKRFKFQEHLGRYSKLSYRVAFPLELRLFNTADGADNADRLYHLHGVIVHIGSGPQSGHYVALIKSDNQWLLFDDEDVSHVEESDLGQFFGDSNSQGTGYCFFYTAADFEATKVMRSIMPDTWSPPSQAPSAKPPVTIIGGQVDEKDPSVPPATPVILATYELDGDEDEEDQVGDMMPPAAGNVYVDGGQGRIPQPQSQSQLQPQHSSASLPGSHKSSSSMSTDDGSQTGSRFGLPKLNVGGRIGSGYAKRPSLPVLQTESFGGSARGDLQRGPMTAVVADHHSQNQGKDVSSNSGNSNSSNGNGNGNSGKDGGWAWFPSIGRKDKPK
ncbi:hypothetical protein BC831DRAFT_470701 [Entophlyctis helioformis]|nr:hypothetical protein BC831DRAFT_470701 [Entophlyctis helioformis]